MTRSFRTLALVAVLAGAAAPRALVAQEPDTASREQRAQRSAEAWLALIGEGKYAESWQQASTLFKQAVTAEQWTQQGAAVTAQVGAFQRRELQDAQYTTELPNVPPGEYMVLTYSSAFANVPNARETMALVLEEGEWRVIGYFIQPA